MRRVTASTLAILTLLFVAPSARGQVYDSGSTGVLGALTPTENTTVLLPPGGVLHYTVVDIPSGVTVTFQRNAQNTPVYLLATGDVMISGKIDVAGKATGSAVNRWWVTQLGGLGGPGGGDGGSTRIGSGYNIGSHGTGPGPGAPVNNPGWGDNPSGGASPVSDGSTYANGPAGGKSYVTIGNWVGFGGSGGGSSRTYAGGGGGGALTIASSTTITVNGTIDARGGSAGTGGSPSNSGQGGGGGGGVVRLVASAITGTGSVLASRGSGGCNSYGVGGCGGHGLVMMDAYDVQGLLTTKASPKPYFGLPDSGLPYPPTKRPSLVISTVDGVDPVPNTNGTHPLAAPGVSVPEGTTITVVVDAAWVPPGTAVKVAVNTMGNGRVVYTTPGLVGSLEASSASIDVNIPAGTVSGTFDAWIAAAPLPAD